MTATATAPRTTTAAAITEVLENATAGMTQAELVVATGKGRSTITEALQTLVANGSVGRDDSGRVARFHYAGPGADVTESAPVGVTVDESTTEGHGVAIPAPVEVPAAPAADAPAPACHCGDDEVGHVHPRAITAGEKRPVRAPAAAGNRAGKSAAARAAALAALAAGPLPVEKVWEAMQVTAGMAHQGAYTLLNTLITEGVVTATTERKVRDRTVSLPAAQ